MTARRLLTTIALGGVLLAAGLASAQGTTIVNDGDAVSIINQSQPQSASSYWTLERRSTARPMPFPEVSGLPISPRVPPYSGPPGAQAGILPDGVVSAEDEANDTSLREAEPQIFGGTEYYAYPPPFSRFALIGHRHFPHTTLGKLFFSDGIGNNFVCSGSAVVCTGDQDLVMTAGHCCSDGAGNFFTNFLFVPACRGPGCSNQPFGVWNWESVTLLNAWHLSGDLARDVCWLKVQQNGGQQLHQVVGSLGFAFNQAHPIHYHQSGYPAEAPFSGDVLTIAAASTAEFDGSFTPNTVGLGNDMTGGSSGGGWIKGYRPLGTPTATRNVWNGLNSYKYTMPARPDEMFGPYIDTTISNTKAGGSVNCP